MTKVWWDLARCEECYTKSGNYVLKFKVGNAEIHRVSVSPKEAAEFQKGYSYRFTARFREYKANSDEEPILIVDVE